MDLVMRLGRGAVALAVIMISIGAHAEEPNPLLGTSTAHVAEVFEVALEEWVPNDKRKKVAQWGLEYLRTETAKKLKVPIEKITGEFAKDPELIASMGLKATEGLGGLFTAFSRLENTIVANTTLSNCKTESGLLTEVRTGVSAYCPRAEAQFNHQIFVWQDRVEGKIASFQVPSFAYSENLDRLLTLTAQVSIESNRTTDGYLRPDLATIGKSSGVSDPTALNELMAIADLRVDAFERSLVGSLKTVLEMRASFGKSALDDTALAAFGMEKAKLMCPKCPTEQITRIVTLAEGAVREKEKKLIAQGERLYIGPEKALRGICDRLKRTRDSRGAPFYASRVSASHLTPFNLMFGPGSVEMKSAWNSKKEILKQVISEGREGVLLLTNALTQYEYEPGEKNSDLSKEQVDPGNVNFTCREPLDPVYVEKIGDAMDEAVGYAAEFGRKTAENLRAEKFDRHSLLQDLKDLMRTNPRAVGESLSRSASLAPFVCEALHSVDRDETRARMSNKLIMWGSVVVGTAITATGVLAPAGSALCASAVVGGAALGAATGIYDLVQARYSRIEAELYRDAAVAQEGSLARLKVSNEKLDLYAQQKLSGILNLGLSVTDAGILALKKVFPVVERTVANSSPSTPGLGRNALTTFDQVGVLPKDLARNFKIETMRATLDYGIDPTSPASRELRDIIINAKSASELKVGVQAWAKNHDIPYRPVFIDDLKVEIENLQRKGLAPKDLPKEYVQTINNFIEPNAYNFLIRNKIIPIADPHDLLSHLSVLEDARFVRAHDAFSEIDNEIFNFSSDIEKKRLRRNPEVTEKALGEPDLYSSRLWKDKRTAFQRSMDRWQLDGPGRSQSLEDFAYLKDVGGKKRLVIHGNAGINGISALQRKNADGFIDYILGEARGSEFPDPSMTKVFARKFLEDPANAAIISRMRKAGEDVGIDFWDEGTALVAPRRRLREQVVKLISTQKAQGVLDTNQIDRVMSGIADFISKDPQLAKIYSYSSRMEVLEAHNAITKRYLEWIKKNAFVEE